jgi:tetraacyldisaccharide 4'-kinase
MSWLDDLWWRDAPARPGPALPLAAAEQVFRAAAAVRGALYRTGLATVEEAAAPVISIGNLVVGGAGKTPAVIAVAGRLLRRGRRVAVLSRGYGARRADARVVSDGSRVLLASDDAGDEPSVLARRLPAAAVLCGPDRAALARRAASGLGADALVLDDGFQHRRLARDLDVVVVDAASPVGNGRLLPRGPNREPWSALGRAHLAWISRCDQVDAGDLLALGGRLRAATGRAPVTSRHAVTDVLDGTLGRGLGRDALGGARVLAVCALARPDGFRKTLAALGARVAAQRTYRDHHAFTDAEVEALLREARAAGCDAVATTEKDAVRIPAPYAADPLWRVVRIDAEIVTGATELDALLDEALARGDARRAAGTGSRA